MNKIKMNFISADHSDEVSALTMPSSEENVHRLLMQLHQRSVAGDGAPVSPGGGGRGNPILARRVSDGHKQGSHGYRNSSIDSGDGNDNPKHAAVPRDEKDITINRLTDELVHAKLELAITKTSEDCLKLELAKVKMALEQAEKEVEALRREKVEALADGAASVITGNESSSSTIIASAGAASEAADIVGVSSNAVGLLRSSARRMPDVPSCASGLALLYGTNYPSQVAGLGADLRQFSYESLSTINRSLSLSRRPPSCASGIALLRCINTHASLSSVNSMSSLGKRKSSADDEASAALRTKRPSAGFASAVPAPLYTPMRQAARRTTVDICKRHSLAGPSPPRPRPSPSVDRRRSDTLSQSLSRYDAQRNEEWGDATTFAARRDKDLFKDFLKRP